MSIPSFCMFSIFQFNVNLQHTSMGPGLYKIKFSLSFNLEKQKHKNPVQSEADGWFSLPNPMLVFSTYSNREQWAFDSYVRAVCEASTILK